MGFNSGFKGLTSLAECHFGMNRAFVLCSASLRASILFKYRGEKLTLIEIHLNQTFYQQYLIIE